MSSSNTNFELNFAFSRDSTLEIALNGIREMIKQTAKFDKGVIKENCAFG